MHPLHDYIARQIAERLRARRVVVWYDERGEFGPFVAELRVGASELAGPAKALIDGGSASLIEYAGSFFEVRMAVEPFVSGDEPERVLVYVPGCERDRIGSVLMELEKAGNCYEPQLKRLARNILRQRYTDGVIDEMLAPERVTYHDLARALVEEPTAGPPSMLKAIFHGAAGTDGLLAEWLASDEFDSEIETKEAARELTKLVRSRLGLELPEDAGLAKLRAITLRYVLGGEFRSDLEGTPPAVLESVPLPSKKDELSAVRELARRLRATFPEEYAAAADRAETELGLRDAKIPGDALGSIDTFRFEERTLLNHCSELVAAGSFEGALKLFGDRERNFWLDRDVGRKAQWEASRRMAELGSISRSVMASVARAGSSGPSAWVDAYTANDGWYRLDQAQRRLEAWVANLDEEPDERPLGVVRRAYEDTCHAMATGFAKSLVGANWQVAGVSPQTRVYADMVAVQPKPTAYFLVDAMRFEMGLELAERLPTSAEISVRPAIASLPTITPVGMAALQPGAGASFSVIEQGGRLGALIDGAFLPEATARRKFAASRVPNLVDMTLDELLTLQASRLAKRLDEAQIVIVRSQEIDHAGEAGFTYHARQVMDTVIDNLARAVRKLAAAGVEHSVVVADHGHLFFPTDRDESMRIDAPGGDQVDLHRRCWVGRGGSTPPGCVRVAAATLGYASDLDFVFPVGAGVFRAGGDLAFHHGGPSLQELIVPVLAVRLKLRESAPPTGPVSVSGLPEAVTNRIFSVTLQLGGPNLSLFSGATIVRPLLMSAGKQVGAVGMAIGADLDRAAGTMKLEAGKPVTIGFLLSDESVPSLRVIVQDPATDAELYRSPIDIPVRLGI